METGIIISSVLLWILLLFNLALTLGLIRRFNAQGSHKKPPDLNMPGVGEPAPDFSASTLDGEMVSLATYAGHQVALVFISTACTPCAEFLPQLEILQPYAEKSGVKLLLASNKGNEETLVLLEKVKVNLPTLIAPHPINSLFDAYKATMTPSYCLIDEQGMVLSSGLANFRGGAWEKLAHMWEHSAAPTDNERR